MIKTLLTILFTIGLFGFSYSNNGKKHIDSLLRELDVAIDNRLVYILSKESEIEGIKKELTLEKTKEGQFGIHNRLISEYQSFKCDSALKYIGLNIKIAEDLHHQDKIDESKLKLVFVLSLSGLFSQAEDVFQGLDYNKLAPHLKHLYCWCRIRYNENLGKYTDYPIYGDLLLKENERYRDTLMSLLSENSDMYQKEKAFKLKNQGFYEESARIQELLFETEDPNLHGYAMSAMGLSMIYDHLKDSYLSEKYLIVSAITDVRLAVKENESLLTLAFHLYEKGDIDRAFRYIQAALDDANFYNSRFRNAVIARTQPLIEATYLAKIEEQSKNLKAYSFVTSIFLVLMVITLYFLYKQIRKVSNARKYLDKVNTELTLVNHNLDEANHLRERYIGYYINQCALYLDKLDAFRKNVNRKIKGGQIDDLQKLSTSTTALDHDAHELYRDFDKTFLEVYPNFVEQFNDLLREEERYTLKEEQLNTELRIFALIRLGISDVHQIATFLRYSPQTIYNYKSKVKGKSLSSIDNFEEKVSKIGSISIK